MSAARRRVPKAKAKPVKGRFGAVDKKATKEARNARRGAIVTAIRRGLVASGELRRAAARRLATLEGIALPLDEIPAAPLPPWEVV